MFIIAVIVSIALPFVRVALATTQRQPASKLLVIAGKRFQTISTDHFTIAYDTPIEALRPLMDSLEDTYDSVSRFCALIDPAGAPPKNRLEVVFFSRHEDFTRYLSGKGLDGHPMAGAYLQQDNVTAFSNVEDNPDVRRITRLIEHIREQLRKSEETPADPNAARQRREGLHRSLVTLRSRRNRMITMFNRLVVRHEIAHQTFFNLGVLVRGADNPHWLVEGLACQFEVPRSGITNPLPSVNHLRLADFRDALRAGPNAAVLSDNAYKEALVEGDWLLLTDLISHTEPITGGDETDLAFRYAQSWALVYFLLHQHYDAFVTYLRGLGTRKPGREVDGLRELDEFRAAFGEPDEVFEREWISYILKLKLDRR